MAHRHDDILEATRDFSADGDRRAHGFAAFARLQYGGLLSFLRRRTANEEDARDATQESLMRLMRYRDTETEAAWRPLLYRIAINVVGEQYRRGSARQRSHHVPIDDLELMSDEPTQEDLVVHAQQEALLRQALLSLPPRWRQVYLLSRMEGMTYAQIAVHCGISVKTVEKHMTNALAALFDRVGSGASDAS
ncbi:RNA polymerase sigma factor [Dyella jiangningensis]|uniref:RNA polymerase subunit sigma-70 n=1 Tax=Dyella jiangningensis TaxID=1379159 RepID=A0A328P179_9GAMM|nr:sigma-70 family RNA polymerase sigma factor [Dyella jiangningensis]RAO75141.1 hypothetical protein CA260_13625 [Dyella jiangningensis]